MNGAATYIYYVIDTDKIGTATEQMHNFIMQLEQMGLTPVQINLVYLGEL